MYITTSFRVFFRNDFAKEWFITFLLLIIRFALEIGPIVTEGHPRTQVIYNRKV